MGRIVTFYSYKGGVGRSMALANVALLLARRGLKVLVVDWDLEAPGLERYFSYFEVAPAPGLLHLFRDACTRHDTDWRAYATHVPCETSHPITLLPSGRESDSDYSRELERFDWNGFYRDHAGGEFVERLRNEWRRDFDIVLIDSRTGLSDTGGICTIQLPDIVVAMFTANMQSLYGVRDVLRLAQQARQSLAYDRMALSVLPLPARWGTQEFQESQVWTERIAEAVQEFVGDWLPRPLTARDVIQRVKVPQRDFFGYGEKLAVIEQGIADPTGMGHVYDRVATFLASDLSDIEGFLGDKLPAAPAAPSLPTAAGKGAHKRADKGPDYAYDVYVSHDGSQPEWTLEFIDHLRSPLQSVLGRDPRLFVDVSELRLGDDISARQQEALERSALLLPIITQRYVDAAGTTFEYRQFLQRSRALGRNLIAPVVLRVGMLPAEIAKTRFVDLRKFPQRNPKGQQPPWAQLLFGLAKWLAAMRRSAPDQSAVLDWTSKTFRVEEAAANRPLPPA